jgi:hypothetical protein
MINARNPGLKKSLLAAAAALLFSATAMAQSNTTNGDQGSDDEDVVLSFATVGDSRQDPINLDPSQVAQGGLTGQDSIWLQNTKAWSRIMRGIQSQKAKLLFFNGDMVMGYGNGTALNAYKTTNVNGTWKPTALPSGLTTDTTDFYAQYAFWRGMVANLMETGTYVVPVPGNHETQCKACGKKATADNEAIWRDNMADLTLDTKRFASILGSGPDYFDADNHPQVGEALASGEAAKIYTTDQSHLSYSFDYKGSHFAVVNTDATGVDGRAPAVWLAKDLEAANGRGAKHFFVFGHKPAYTYKFTDPATGLPITKLSGLDATSAANQKEFWDAIEKYHATYFSGHMHTYNMQQPRLNDATNPGTAWQVLVGSGGSPFESAVATNNPNDRKYAWANVKIYESGKVRIEAWGFDENYGPTKLLQTVTLTAGKDD